MIFKEHIKDIGYRPVFSGGELRDRGINPKSTGKGFLYTWNANGSLRSVTNLEGTTYRFRYDAFGRRLEKRRMASTFRFVWDGNVLLHETFKKDNSEHTELTTWVFEGFVPTAKLVNGKAYSIISDHLGTPILAIDSDGLEVWNRQLDIYGRVRKEYKHSSLGDDVFPFVPFLYQGQYYDFETNLAYNRFRYYSPETGAYINQDPIGLAGGNPTLYGYVGDNNTWVDRFGLDCFKVDKTMSEGDKLAGVLNNNGYIKNPTSIVFNDLQKTSGGRLKLDDKSLNGKYMYVIDTKDNFIIGTRNGSSRMPHPTLIGGINPEVKTAGIIEFRGGKIYSIDNASGHFKPKIDSLKNVQSHLENVDKKTFHKDFSFKDFDGNKV